MLKDFVHLIQCKIKRLREAEDFKTNLRNQVIKSALFLLGVVAFVKCVTTFVPQAVSVSSTINGRELPIYCVETDEKRSRFLLMPPGETKIHKGSWKYWPNTISM